MQFRLSYSEIEQLAESKAGQKVPMSYGGPHTLRIAHQVPLMGSVGVDINVDRIEGTDLFLSFSGGAAIEFMLRSALNQAKNRPGMEKSPNLAPIFERVTLQDICFDEQSIIIQFAPKL